MIVKTYDPASYDLAEYFLQDEPCRNDPELYKAHCDSLAKCIQQAVEDWLFVPDEPPRNEANDFAALGQQMGDYNLDKAYTIN